MQKNLGGYYASFDSTFAEFSCMRAVSLATSVRSLAATRPAFMFCEREDSRSHFSKCLNKMHHLIYNVEPIVLLPPEVVAEVDRHHESALPS